MVERQVGEEPGRFQRGCGDSRYEEEESEGEL